MRVEPADEGRHPAGSDPWWNESWYFDFAAPDGSLGGYVRLGLYPNLGVAWYWATLVGPGRPLVLMREHEAALPKGDSLEVRHEGLWADHTCETPLEHWSLGLEAFAVALDDPAEAFRGERGERVPFGLDLEWETDGGSYPYPGIERYEVPCRVHGDIVVGDERIAFDGVGERDHSWGPRDWWMLGWWWTTFHLGDGTTLHGMRLDLPNIDFHASFLSAPAGGGDLVGQIGFQPDDQLDDEGLLVASQMTYGERGFRVDPIAHAPLLLVDEAGGRRTRFARSLCRWTDAASGDTGVGWYERNQPAS